MATSLFAIILLKLFKLERRLFWETSCRPYLSMWMGIRATHCGTFVFEDLHPPILIPYRLSHLREDWRVAGVLDERLQLADFLETQMRCVDRRPRLNDRQYLICRHVCQCLVVGFAECEHVAFADDGLCFEEHTTQTRWAICWRVLCLGLLDSTIVIDKHKHIVVVGIVIAGSSLVTRTQVALRVVFWKIDRPWTFLLSLPWSLGPMRRHQNPAAS